MPTQSRSVTVEDYRQYVDAIFRATSLDGHDGLYFRVARIAAKITNAKHAVVVVPTSPTELRVVGCYGYPTAGLPETLDPKTGVIGLVFEQERAERVPNVSQHGRYRPFEADCRIRSELAVPALDAAREHVEAVINVESIEEAHFADADTEALQNLGDLMLLSRERIEANERLAAERTAAFEVLWNLPDEVMVIDSDYRPVWANREKRKNLPELNTALPSPDETNSDLAALLRGQPASSRRCQSPCHFVLERRTKPCPCCVCRKAIARGGPELGVIYEPNHLDCIVELSATPLFLEGKQGEKGTLLGCVEIARRVTKRQRVLDIAPTLWTGPAEDEAMQSAVSVLHEHLQYRRVRLYLLDRTARTLRAVTLAGDHGALTGSQFRGAARDIPAELWSVLSTARKAGLITIVDTLSKIEPEESFGYWQVRVPRSAMVKAFDPDGALQLEGVDELAVAPLHVEQDSWLFSLDGLGPSGAGGKGPTFSSDDLQALTIYVRLASAALESTRQSDRISRLAVLGEVAAALTHEVTRIMGTLGAQGLVKHLGKALDSLVAYLRDIPGQADCVSFLRVLAERMSSDGIHTVHGDVAAWVKKVQRAMREAGVEVPDDAAWDLGLVLPSAEVVPDEWIRVLGRLPGNPWIALRRLAQFMVVLRSQQMAASQLRTFSEAVKGAFAGSGSGTETRGTVNFSRLVHHAVHAVEKRAKVIIQETPHMVDGQEKPLYLDAKEGQILLALLALLDNAICAAASDPKQPLVQVTSTLVSSHARVSIANNGRRPTDAQLRMLGRKRFSTKGGIGIGYMLADGLVRANEGEIRIHYDASRGMTAVDVQFKCVEVQE
jgi:GAF domain-containing protein